MERPGPSGSGFSGESGGGVGRAGPAALSAPH